MEKYSSIVKMEQIKEYLQNEKNEEALEIAAEIDLTKVKDKYNYMVLAKVFLNNGLLSKAKDCYAKIYEKSPSRHIVMELANLSLRLKSLVEAERYIDEFQRMAPENFMNHIFKYKVDRLKGKSPDELVVSLEKLKKAEFFDNWGFELAKLYNKLGQTEKCIAACNDVIIWFGSGEYVDKAKALRDLLTKEPIDNLFCDERYIPQSDDFDVKEFVESFKTGAYSKKAAAPQTVEKETADRKQSDEKAEESLKPAEETKTVAEGAGSGKKGKRKKKKEKRRRERMQAMSGQNAEQAEPVEMVQDNVDTEPVEAVQDNVDTESVEAVQDNAVSEPVNDKQENAGADMAEEQAAELESDEAGEGEKDPFDIDLVVEEISSKISAFDLGDLGVISVPDADAVGVDSVDVKPDDFGKTGVDLKLPDEFEKTRVDLVIPNEVMADLGKEAEMPEDEPKADTVNDVLVVEAADTGVNDVSVAEVDATGVNDVPVAEIAGTAENDSLKIEAADVTPESLATEPDVVSGNAAEETVDGSVATVQDAEIDEDEALIMRLLEEETKNLAFAVKKAEVKTEAPVAYNSGKSRVFDVNYLKLEEPADGPEALEVGPKKAETVQPKEAKLNSSGMLERYLANNDKRFEGYFGFFAYQQEVSEQLAGMLDVMLSDKKYISFTLACEKGSGKKAIINGVTKLLADAGQLGSNKPVWAEAKSVNETDMEKKIPKLEGRSLAIDKAGELEKKSVDVLVNMIKEHNIAVVLVDYNQNINKLLKENPELDDVMLNRMIIPRFSVSDLEAFVSYKATDSGLTFSEEAYELVLKKVQSIVYTYDEGTLARTEKLMAEVIDNTENRNAKVYLEKAKAGASQFDAGMILKEDIPS